MGVKYFYYWYKNQYPSCISNQYPGKIDIVAIDLNGMFHLSAQKVYRYGNNATLLTKNVSKSQIPLFREICHNIHQLILQLKPSKKILLCVDGVAGLAKMNQQRQRRFRSGLTSDPTHFNPNAFTPGTKLMDHLTKYIDWYIRSMMTNEPMFQHLDIIFSNEKVPGEGEHKIMYYLRTYGNPSDTVCIYGLDADLVMLSLMLPLPYIYIARESDYGSIEYVNIYQLKKDILERIQWDPCLDEKRLLHDFVLLTIFIGNDFLPSLIHIYDGIFDVVLDLYRQCQTYLTRCDSKTIQFEKQPMIEFLTRFSEYEKEFIERKYNSQQAFFPDPLVLKHLRLEQQKNVINFPQYQEEYYTQKFPNVNATIVATEYLRGMLWILHYYKFGMPDWNWYYPYYYGPFLKDLVIALQCFENSTFSIHEPVDPFLQLLLVMPETSKQLLPIEFDPIFLELGEFFPKVLTVDLTGKRKEWEGIVILPFVDLERFRSCYETYLPIVSSSDMKRNMKGKNFLYRFNPMRRENFSSFYGNIVDCPTTAMIIHF